MKNVLVLNASLNNENGNSALLAKRFTDLLAQETSVKLIERNLQQDNLSHLSSEEMAAWMTPAPERTDAQNDLATISDNLIEEVKASDTLVIGLPMYNFGIPSTFKTWIDRIARAGVTFKYTDTGPVGLLDGKKVVVLAARGGMYAGTPKDTQSQYVKDFFAFIGITDVTFVYAEGLNMGLKDEAFAKSDKAMNELVASM